MLTQKLDSVGGLEV